MWPGPRILLSRGGFELIENFAQGGADPCQFRFVNWRQRFQDAPATRGKSNEYLAPVVSVFRLHYQSRRCHPIHQAHCAVMPDFQQPGKFPHRQLIALRETPDYQHGLVLLRRHAGCQSRFFAEAKKLPERVAECSQKLVIGVRYGGRFFAVDDRFLQDKAEISYRTAILECPAIFAFVYSLVERNHDGSWTVYF